MSLLGEVERVAKGSAVKPSELWAKLARRFTLIGVQGIVRMAMSGFDAACWDALAVASGASLATFLGAERRPIPAYNSCGLGLKDDLGALADEAEKLLAEGFRAIKLRLGYPTVQADIAAVHAVRKRIGDDVALMVDYNQALSVDEALVRGRALDAENIYWLEEPIRHDDYDGAARLARELKVPIQIGENFSLPAAMSVALERCAADYVMPDLERHWRCQRLASGGGNCAIAGHQNVIASISGNERTSARGHANVSLPRICRLGKCFARRAATDRRWSRDRAIASRQRHGLGQESGRTFSNALS
jgi:mandelate racemase